VAHRVKIVPVRLRDHPPGLGCDRLHVIGYRSVCSCGERGPVAARVSTAREWQADHARAESPSPSHSWGCGSGRKFQGATVPSGTDRTWRSIRCSCRHGRAYGRT